MTDKNDNKKEEDNATLRSKESSLQSTSQKEQGEKAQSPSAKKAERSHRADKEAKGAGAAAGVAPVPEAKPARAKAIRNVPAGIVHVNASFNNTHVTITDLKGGVLAWSSAGRMGFKGARKSTAYAATVVAQEAARLVAPYRMQEIEVRVQGPGSGRESAIRALQAAGFSITVIKDVTPMPHNGCRPRKRRRV